jgi:hypothetical protein
MFSVWNESEEKELRHFDHEILDQRRMGPR